MKKIFVALALLLFLPAIASAAPIDNRIDEAQEIFQNFEDGKASYLETVTEIKIWELDGKEVSFIDDDLKRLKFSISEDKPMELYLEEYASGGKSNIEKLKDEIFINIDGKKTKCSRKETYDSGVRKYECDFREKIYKKTIFNGTKATAEFSARVTVRFVMTRSDYENTIFKEERKADFETWMLAQDLNRRELVEKSFPGFAKALCEKNVRNANTIEMILRDIDLANRMTTYTSPNYNFRQMSESYSRNDDEKECNIQIAEDGWDEKKVYKCKLGYDETGQPIEILSPSKRSGCQEELTVKVPVIKISFKIASKKAVVERGFQNAWNKIKSEYSEKSRIEIESSAQAGLEKIKEKGIGSISFKIYNSNASLFEASLAQENGRTTLKPEFSEKSDVRVQIKSDVIYKIYNKFWLIEGNFPEPKTEELKRRFFGMLGTIIELVRGGVSGDVKIEPFWEVGKASAALEKLTAFESCTESFFGKAEKNETDSSEFTKCYSSLR